MLDRAGGAQEEVTRRPGRNLATHPAEAYYALQYLHWLKPLLGDQATVLDVGCGSGRLLAPVARSLPRAQVIGVDVSEGKIDHAREQTAELANVELICGDASALLDRSYDLVLFTEVDFFQRKEIFPAVADAVAPGGTLLASFRSQWFNLAASIRKGDFASAAKVRDAREGLLWGLPHRFRWHTADDIRAKLASFDVELHGIGVLSGMEGDPFETIVDPELLDPDAIASLLDLELSLADRYVECGRYILAVAKAPVMSEPLARDVQSSETRDVVAPVAS